jgi:Phage integrase family
MKSLEWHDIGTEAIQLCAENSKNKKQRVLPLRGELAEIVQRAKDKRKPECPFVFHDKGQPIGDFRKAWQNACVSVGLGHFKKIGERRTATKVYHGLLIHDLRRSAVRNMVAAGIPEKVAMVLSGHKTRSVFDRYHIVSEDDLALSMRPPLWPLGAPGRSREGRTHQEGELRLENTDTGRTQESLEQMIFDGHRGKWLKLWSHPPESNRRPTDYESVALPTELGWLTWV